MLDFITNRLHVAQRAPVDIVPANVVDFQTCAVSDGTHATGDGTRHGIRGGKRRPGWQADAVVLALIREGRALSITELAAAMGVCRGEASKRVARCADRVTKRKAGRHVLVWIAA
jgi:hypothetical protein